MQKTFKTLLSVPELIFAKGAISQLPHLLESLRKHSDYAVLIIDHYFTTSDLSNRLNLHQNDLIFYLDTTNEPTTDSVDHFVKKIKNQRSELPCVVVGIGGGSTMDMAKAISIMLTNPGKTEQYQGWELVTNPPVYKIGVPTLSGTGAEVSRTTVLNSPRKKQGINSDYSLFNKILLDPDLLETVPSQQRFFSGMDCYIHCIESLTGSYSNEFSRAFASKAHELSGNVFLNGFSNADLMVASYMGGYAIVYSEVGLIHALSYGLSHAFHIHHGESNCIVLNGLEEYYPNHLPEFRKMLKKNNVELNLPKNLQYDDAVLEKMVNIVLLMEKPLRNALGPDWQEILTRKKIKELYHRILELK